MNTKTKRITTAALFTALGVLIPFVTGHVVGIEGTILLPMHFSVLTAGFFLGPAYGFYIGILTPLLSSLLTGMPGLYPMLPVMIGELAVYGYLTGYLYKKKLSIGLALVLAMIAGRAVHALIFAGLLLAGGKPATITVCLMFLVQGIPGTMLQLLILPPTIRRIKLECGFERISKPETQIYHLGGKMDREITVQKKKIQDGQISLAVVRDGKVVCVKKGMGISPLLEIVLEQRELLENAVVVDKIVGKAAASLMVLGKVKEVHTLTVSEDGKDYLVSHGIPVISDRCISVIKNRDKTGICPFENAVADVESPQEAFEILQNTLKRLRKNA